MRRIKYIPILLLFLCSASIFAHTTTCSTSNSSLYFIENQNQWHENVEYKVPLGGLNTLYLEDNAFTFVYYDTENVAQMHDWAKLEVSEKEKFCLNGHVYKMSFVDAQKPTFSNLDKRKEYHNYFLGNDESKWAGHVPLYNGVQYEELYQGIDLKTYSYKGFFKYDFLIEPYADVSQIALSYEGQDNIHLQEGNLIIRTSVETIAESKPYAYQIIDGKEVEVSCVYRLEDGIVTFEFTEGYDKSLPLVIDPILVAATLSGSNVENWGHCAAFDVEGNIFTGARCFGSGYPTTTGAFQTNFGGGNVDVAISKLLPDGTDLIYATYIGGSNSDFPHSLYVDLNQNIHVYGSSDSQNYPTTADAFRPVNSGGYDIIVTVINEDGSDLIGSTYVGGQQNDGQNSASGNYGDTYRGEVYVDFDGNTYIASCTESQYFPVSEDAVQETLGGGQDGVLFKLNEDLSELEWSTYLGGSGTDMAYGLRVDGLDNVYVCGAAANDDFPMVSGGLNENHQGGQHDAFIAYITNEGTNMEYSTFWGTGSKDIAFFLDLDNDEDIVIYGQTDGNVQPSPNVYSQPNSSQFIGAVSADLSTEKFTTIVGGGGTFGGYGLVPVAFMVDNCGYIYFSGYYATSGLETTPDALFTSSNCFNCQVYLGVLEKDAEGLFYATYYTGDHVDGGTSRFDDNGVVYQGLCHSGSFNTTTGAWDSQNGFGYDVAVFKIDFEAPGVNAVANAGPAITGCAPLEVTFTNQGSSAISYEWDLGDGNVSNENEPIYVYDNPGLYPVRLIANDPASCNESDTAYIIINVLGNDEAILHELAVCEGEELVLDVESSDDATYQWFDNSTEPTFDTEGVAGTYWVATTLAGCVQIDSFIVANAGSNSVNLGADVILCEGETLMLDATGQGDSFTWQDNSSGPTFSAMTSGTYWVEVNTGGCLARDSIEVEFLSAPVVDLGTDQVICDVEEVLLDGTYAPDPAATYEWQDGSTNPTFTAEESGIYWVEITSSLADCVYRDSVEVTSVSASVDLGGDITICDDASFVLDVDTGNPNATYTWQDNSTGTTFDVTESGLYWVEINVNGCIKRDSVNAVLVPFPEVDLGADQTVCSDESVMLDGTFATDPNATYLWQDGSTAPTFNALEAGIYWVEVSTGATVNCSTRDSIEVIHTGNTIDLGEDLFLCDNGTHTFDVTVNDPNATYLWQNGETEPILTVSESGEYWVEITSGIASCVAIDTVSVVAVTNNPSLGDDLILCNDDFYTLDATVADPDATYLWQDGSTNPTIDVNGGGVYEVDVTINGCVKSSSVNVDIYPALPIINLGPDLEVCKGETHVLQVPNDGNVYVWQDGSTGNTFFVNDAGTYSATVTNECGSRTDEINITYSDFEDVNEPVLMPTGFSPNGDGINDCFKPYLRGEILNYEFMVFSRWGELIFTTEDTEGCWDGFYHDTEAELGVYIWVCKATVRACRGVNNVVKKGNVTLIK